MSKSNEPLEYVYEGFKGCTNIDPDACECSSHEDPQCYYCEEAIEEGQTVMQAYRLNDPFIESEGYERVYAHKVCPIDTEEAHNE